MSDEKFERVFRTVDPGRRAILKKAILGAAFSVPVIASFSMKHLAHADSVETVTHTVTLSETVTATLTETATATVTTCTFGE